MTDEQYSALLAAFPNLKRHEQMSLHTNLRIGGPADAYLVAETSADLVKALELARVLEIPFYVFGGGSNLLVADEGYRGLMVQAADRGLSIQGNVVTLGAGCITALVARKTAEAGLTGFEWAIGVPGTVGGAIYGNAGCYGGEMKERIERVETYDVKKGRLVTYGAQDCGFGYRESRFKHEPHLLLSARLRLTEGDRTAALSKIQDIIEQRKQKQPLDKSSAGCLFKNVEFSREEEIELLSRQLEVPESMRQSKRISAAWLVDRAGLKGTRVNNIEVSSVHANFLVNLGGGRAEDVRILSRMVKEKIRDMYGVALQEEVQMVGF